jgi:hypothetical protein
MGGPIKKLAFVLSLVVSGIALSSAYTSAHAGKMNGKDGMCSDGPNCGSNTYQKDASHGEAQNQLSSSCGNSYFRNAPSDVRLFCGSPTLIQRVGDLRSQGRFSRPVPAAPRPSP